MTASTYSVCLSQCQTLAFRIVVFVNGDQCRNTEATNIFCTNFRTRALRCNHDYSQVFTDLHAFFNDVETVRVRQASAFFHQRHYRFNYRCVLLVWSQVQYYVCSRDQLFVCTNNKTVFSRVFPRLTLFSNRSRAQCVRNIQAAVTQVQTLVKALSTTTDDYHFFAFKSVNTIAELIHRHKTTFTQLFQLLTQWKRIEIVVRHLLIP